jgi:hypothetical protein
MGRKQKKGLIVKLNTANLVRIYKVVVSALASPAPINPCNSKLFAAQSPILERSYDTV